MEYEKIKPEGSSYLHVAIDISFENFMSCENFPGNQLHVLVVEIAYCEQRRKPNPGE